MLPSAFVPTGPDAPAQVGAPLRHVLRDGVLTSHSLPVQAAIAGRTATSPVPNIALVPGQSAPGTLLYCINRTYRDPRHIPVITSQAKVADVATIIRSGERMTELQSELPVRSDPFWPVAMITFGGSLTVAWVILLGYGLVRLVGLAI